MNRQLGFGILLLTIASNLGIVQSVGAQPTGSISIEINELRNREGNVCLKLFNSSEGFPNEDESALQKICLPIENSTVTEPAPTPSDPSEDSTESSTEDLEDSTEGSTERTPASEAPAQAVPPLESDNADPTTESITASANSSESTFRYTFENLPYGNYAIAIYHDRNSNERLNRGLFGMPEEGYGFSNDAPANLGPADFDDAVFALDSTDTTIHIKMRYP